MLSTAPAFAFVFTLLFAPVQDAPPAPDPEIRQGAEEENDPRLIAAYERLVDYLAGVDSCDLTVRLDWKVEGDRDEVQDGRNLYRLQFRRNPDRFRIEVRPGDRLEPTLIVVGDGRNATTFYPARGLYSQKTQLDDPAAALERNPIVAISLSGSLIDTLMRPDFMELVRANATGGTFVGTEEVDGRTLERFSLSWKGDEEELRIGPEDEPLPRSLVRQLTVPTGGDRSSRLVSTASFDWTIGAEVPDSAFEIDLPDDATEVDDIYVALATGSAATLVGGPVPELDLDLLDGGKATLAFHADRDVVLLCFWASWADPCVDLLPRIAALIEPYRDRGLVSFAVNLGEEPEAIRAVLDALDISFNVPLDPDGRAADAFGVTSIPTTVLIARDGTVSAVHLGTGEAVIDALAAQLAALLDDGEADGAGPDLPPPVTPPSPR